MSGVRIPPPLPPFHIKYQHLAGLLAVNGEAVPHADVCRNDIRIRAVGGFELVKDGLHYQEPIKAYTTTVHAKDVGAFTGDFIFTLKKSMRKIAKKTRDVYVRQTTVESMIARSAKNSRTEIEFRRNVYEKLIPLLADWVFRTNGQTIAIAKYAEKMMTDQVFAPLHYHEARSIAR